MYIPYIPGLQVRLISYYLSGRLGGGVAEKVVASGLRCIVSNQDKWYLDHLDATWEGFYMNEPLTNITNHNQQKLVLGGEVCMWGEHIDASDIEQTIWPRAAAAAGTYHFISKLKSIAHYFICTVFRIRKKILAQHSLEEHQIQSCLSLRVASIYRSFFCDSVWLRLEPGKC